MLYTILFQTVIQNCRIYPWPFPLIFRTLHDLIIETLCKECIMKYWHKAKLTTKRFQWFWRYFILNTVWKVPKYGSEKTPYLQNFHAVKEILLSVKFSVSVFQNTKNCIVKLWIMAPWYTKELNIKSVLFW